MAKERQDSFAGGEFAPTLWGRTSFQKYAIGCRTLRNFIATPHGAAASKPGSRLVAETKASAKARIERFVFSTDDTLLLAWGNLYVRFYRLDLATGLAGVVESAPGVPLEVATPYVEADLDRLCFSQVGDVVTITHHAYQTRELTRVSALVWTLGLAATTPAVMPPISLWLGGAENEGNESHPPKEHEWVVTSVDAHGSESAPSPPLRPSPKSNATASDKIALYPDMPATVGWYPVPRAVAYNAYRGRSGVRGLVGRAQNVTFVGGVGYVFFRDDGDVPNYSVPPPRGVSLFQTRDWAPKRRYEVGDVVANGGALYECLVEGVSAAAGGPTGTGSAVLDGTTDSWAADTDYSVGDRIVSKGSTYECIQAGHSRADSWAAPYQCALAPVPITDNTIRWIWLGSGAQITWRYIGVAPQKKLYPALVAHHEQRRLVAASDAEADTVRFSRIDRYSDFEVNTTLADAPLSLSLAQRQYEEVRALVSREDLLVFTSASEWVITGSGQGVVIKPDGVAAHPISEHGSPRFPQPVAVGTAVLFLERSGSRPHALVWGQSGYDTPDLSILSSHLFRGRTIVSWAYAAKPWSIVWAVTSDGALLSCTWLREHEVLAWARHDTAGDAYEGVATLPEGQEDGVYVVVRRTVAGVTKRYIERLTSREITDATEAVCLDSALTYRGAPATHLSGLEHLEGREVWALADGCVAGPFTVVAGAIDLPVESFPDGASVVHVGLRYDCDFESLDPPTERGRQKIVSKVWVEVEASRGFLVGESLAGKLAEWRQRKVSDGYGPPALESTIVEVPITGRWGKGGRVAVRQSDPLPLTITAITREVEHGG